MAVRECILQAVTDGKMSKEGADQYLAQLEDAEKLAAQRGMGAVEAYLFASSEAARKMAEKATSKRAQVLQQSLAVDRVWEDANRHKNGLFRGLETVFGLNVRAGGTAASIEARRMALLSTFQREMSDFLAATQTRMAGLKADTVLPQHVLKALYGGSVPDKLGADSAKAWTKMVERWVDMMRTAGVPVGRMEDWRLPQHWDPLAVRAMGEDRFVAWGEEMWRRDAQTGSGLALRDWSRDGEAKLVPGTDDAKARDILSTAYKNITTDGAATVEPGVFRTADMADRYGRRRVFEWTTAESYLEFNETLGVGNQNLGELMHRHVESMARDLALVQTLGPNPDQAFKILMQMAGRDGLSPRRLGNLEDLYFTTSGKSGTPVSQALALGGQAVRSGLAASQLGGAVLTSPSDFAFTRATASWNGLDMTKIMMRYAEGLSPKSAADRAEAIRRNLILEVGLRGSQDAARDVIGDMTVRQAPGLKWESFLQGASRVAGRSAEFVIRAQGLAHHTQVLRNAFGLEFQAHFHDLAHLPFDVESGPKIAAGTKGNVLPHAERRTLERYGITSDEWDILRKKTLNQGFMDPGKLAIEGQGAEREAGLKMLGAMIAEQRMAVPEANAVTRSYVLGQTRPGTMAGEALRSLIQYKGFAMSAGLMHGWRAVESLADTNGQWFRGQYMAALMIQATVMGAVALQLKNIAYGKDPEPMFDLEKNPFFWAKAFAQGGAGGVFGDYLKTAFSTRSSGDAARALTPTAGLVSDIFALSTGNLGESLEGKDSHTGREAVRFARKYVPEVWYTRLAMDRLVWDTLQRFADPDAAGAFSRMEERTRKEQATRFWWRPGSSEPRTPEFSRALQ